MNIFEILGSLVATKNIALGVDKKHPLYVQLNAKSDEYLVKRYGDIQVKNSSFQGLNTRRSKFQFARNIDIWTEEKVIKQILNEREEDRSRGMSAAMAEMKTLFDKKVFIEGDIKDPQSLVFHKVNGMHVNPENASNPLVDIYLNCTIEDIKSNVVDRALITISTESVNKNIADKKWYVVPTSEFLKLFDNTSSSNA
jgi:hypothetical protein